MAPVQKLVTSAAVAAGLLWGSTASAQAYVRLYPDKDVTIYSEDGSRDNGTGATLFIGGTASTYRRVLIHFDTSSIPSGSTISTVYLYLYMRGVPSPGSPPYPANDTFYAHRMTAFWYEGNEAVGGNPLAGCAGGVPSDPSCSYPTATYPSPTWNWQYYGSTTWSAGANALLAPTASASWAEDTATGWKLFSDTYVGSSYGLVYDVQQWVNGGFSNYGWGLLVYPGNQYSARYFDSREAGNGTPPILDVYYYKPLGVACSAGECYSGNCVDGVCCDSASCSAPECQFNATCNGSSPGFCTTSNYGTGQGCTSDGNNCTIDHCNGSGSCVHTAGNAGTSCPDDGNPCTADRCDGSSTSCQHPAGNSGAACADDGNPCTFDQCNGSLTTCQHPANNSGTCTDGNACTTDTCSGGSCVSGPPKTCTASDQCHNAGTCNPADGTCSTPAKADGSTCTQDSNPCTHDQCVGGTCTTPPGNAGASCPDDGNPCTTDTCNGVSATCQHAPGNAGAQCSGPSCACPGGVCAATLPATCTGSSATCPTPGTVDCGGASCSGNVCAGGCVDDSGCMPTSSFFCLGGQCKPKRANGDPAGCAGNDYCTSGFCVDGYCCNNACAGGGGDCQACNVGGKLGTCSPLAANTLCRAQNGECDAADKCDGTSTVCTDGKQPNGTGCTDDGLICTTDTCQSGTCTHANGNTGVVCNPLAGTCDVAEKCTGSSPTCPTDGYAASTASCRTASCTSGVQTNATNCTGTGPTCPAAVTKNCAPYVCGATACKTSCATDADCSTGNWCNGNLCVPKLGNGNACASGNSCTSGLCIDGVCCNGACTGECEACDVAGKVGTCSPVTGAPHGSRTPCATDASLCGGTCNGTTRTTCTYPGSGTQCRTPSCAGSTATLAASCNGAGACPAVQTQDCGDYVCSGSACRGDCNTDVDCISGDHCSAKVCTKKKDPGATCGTDAECKSGHCVDKVCCDQACSGQCQACDVKGKEGKCTPVAGDPHGGRAPCASDGTICGGKCDGKQVNVCAYPGDGVVCHDAVCTSDTATLLAYCNGGGSCPPEQRQDCGPNFKCDSTGTRCAGDCLVDKDCGFGEFCSAGVCAQLLVNGDPCGASTQCASSYCVDGVCCNGPCTGQCESCNQTGDEGTCTPVSGAPQGIRPACESDGSVCGGACNGVLTTSCAYPDKAKSCRAASCTNDVATLATSCSGDGRCPVAILQSCGANACSGSICGGGCTADANCAGTEFCAGGVCVTKLPLGSICSADAQCAGAHCVDGFCCDTACSNQCQACDVILHVGTCTTVPAGEQPHGGRQPCAGVSACAATCDGTKTTSCTFPGRSKVCGLALCQAGVETQPSTCNGTGSCLAAASNACDPYVCDTTGGTQQCLTQCTQGTDCVAGFGCVNGACILGAPRDGGGPAPVDAAGDVTPIPGDATAVDTGSAGTTGTGGATSAGGSAGLGGTASGAGGTGTGDTTSASGSAGVDAGLVVDAGTGTDAGHKAPGAAPKDEGGCGCRVANSASSHGAAWPLAGLLLLGLRRARRPSKGAHARSRAR